MISTNNSMKLGLDAIIFYVISCGMVIINCSSRDLLVLFYILFSLDLRLQKRFQNACQGPL